jgi:ABC-2 type transport system permease protein
VRLGRLFAIFRAMLRVSVAEAATYRAESVIWLLATTMPFVMMALFSAVAEGNPVGHWTSEKFTAYFLATFIVRNTTGSWAAWQMNMDIKDGVLAVRLLRPAPPLFTYAADNLASLPIRGALTVPVAFLLLLTQARGSLPHEAHLWLAWALSMASAWLLNLLANMAIGTLAFFIDSSVKIISLYLAANFLLSGYLFPIDLMPPRLLAVADHLPFRFQHGLPVEILTGALPVARVWPKVLEGWAYVAALGGLTFVLWRSGVKRFAAFGG